MTNTIIHGNQNTTKLINQLKLAAKQYPTLSKQKEHELIIQYKNDRESLNKMLFMHNIKAVFNIAKKYVSKTNDFDGLVQDGMIGLGEATRRFDPTKDIKFITYAHCWIKKYILQNFDERKNKIDRNSMSMNAPNQSLQSKSSCSGQDITLENYINEFIEPTQDTQKSIQSELSSHEQTSICNKLMQSLEGDTSLSATDKAVFIDYFYNHEKTRDIADKYGLTIEAVTETRSLILEKMRDQLKNQYQIMSYDDI